MQIIIDISEMTLLNITSRELLLCSREDIEKLEFAIKNGTVLPKGHGDLIDRWKLVKELSVVLLRPVQSQMWIIEQAPTIIEADKAESEDKEWKSKN